MDAGPSNTGNSWYERGYNISAPTTGLPAPGSTITNQSASDHIYTLPPSYSANDAALIDALHTANLIPVMPNTFSALSFLTAAGHGPVTVDYVINHTDGSLETGSFVSPDWFFNTPIVLNAQGRVDVSTGNFNNVNNNNPRIYSKDIILTNTISAVTNIHLAWNNSNSGSRFATVFAVSGLAPIASPFNLTVSPLTHTQYVGATASFSVTANGSAPFNYQWTKESLPIFGATKSTLVLSDLSTKATGNYACAVSNRAGGDISGSVVLTVMDRPTLEFTFSGGQLVLTWSNTASLLEASNLLGPWITNSTAASPYEVSPEAPTQFFRLQIQ